MFHINYFFLFGGINWIILSQIRLEILSCAVLSAVTEARIISQHELANDNFLQQAVGLAFAENISSGLFRP